MRSPLDTFNYCTLYIARHGETHWNHAKRIHGHSDIELTGNGIAQAEELAQHFKSVPFDAVFSSDLLRAKRTADIVAKEHSLVVTAHKLLREIYFGDLEGVTYDDFHKILRKELEEFKMLASDQEKYAFKLHITMESDEEAVSRALLFLREASLAYKSKTVLIVCHGSLMKALLWKFGLGTYDELDYERVLFKILRI